MKQHQLSSTIAIVVLIFCVHSQSFSQTDWHITGNSATNSATNFVGTTDNQELVLRTNNAERMRILTTGNIGIGTKSPLQKLHVNGNINIDNGFALYMANNRILSVDSLNGNTFLGNGIAVRNTGKYNTANGFQALASNTTGTHNTANGYKVLYSNTTGWFNIATGSAALYHNTSGSQNIASGYEALYTNTTGSSNIAIGHFALASNTTGSSNTANGDHALFTNTTGSNNIANGVFALYNNTTGSSNTATGDHALFTNNTGSNNIANGAFSLYNNTTGSSNTATGDHALFTNNTGSNNIANGAFSLYNNTTGGSNTAIGDHALFSNNSYYNTATGCGALSSNTTGRGNIANGAFALGRNFSGSANTATGYSSLGINSTGSFNTANGNSALEANTGGNYNTASGNFALGYNTTGNFNTAYGGGSLQNNKGSDNAGIGFGALYENTTGEQNTAVGTSALSDNTESWGNTALGYNAGNNYWGRNGWNNTFLGSGSFGHNSDIYNSTAIGNNTEVYNSNEVRIGNKFVTSIGGYTSWTNISDGRVKKNITENVPGLTFINKLKAVTYNLDLDAVDKIVPRPAAKDKDGKLLTQKTSQAEINARNAKQQIVYTGFVAQDVEKAAKELNYDFSGVDAAKNNEGLYGLRYSEFVVPLVKAVQDLSKQNDSLKLKMNQFENLKSENQELKARLELIEQKLGIATPNKNSTVITLNDGRLEQNIPNPFSHSTTINYILPQQYSSAKIIITDKSGKSVKEVNISGIGKKSLQVDTSTLPSATYQYSLYIDGKLIGTKQMVLLKQTY